MKKRFLIIALLIIITAYLGNGIYDNKMKLDEGFFLEHDIDVLLAGGFNFNLYFIDNRYESRHIAKIELLNLNAPQSFSLMQNYERYGKQEMYVFNFNNSISDDDYLASLAGTEINEAKIYYTNGKTSKLPLGSIRFIAVESATPSDINSHPLLSYSSGGSSDGTGFIGLRSEENVTITSSSANMPLSLEGAFCYQLSVTGPPSSLRTTTRGYNEALCHQSLIPDALSKGDTLWIDYQFDNNRMTMGYSSLQIDIRGTLENGKPFHYITHPIESPLPSSSSIKALIKQKRSEAS